MNSTDNETVLSVEGEVLPESATGKITEDMVLMSMRMMDDEGKVELMKQASKILNAQNKRMNKLLRVARPRTPRVSISSPRIRIR